MQHHLEQGLIPFWRERAADRALGGYRTNFNEQGQALPQPDKYLNTQCRLLWWFARLNRAYPDQPDSARCPTTASTSPGSTPNETSTRAGTVPKYLVRP